MHAIYFISPSEESVDFIVRDFNEEEKTYSHIHIVFNSFISDELKQYILNQKSIIPYIVNLKNIYLDFEVEDNSLITLRKHNLIKTLYTDLY